VSAGVTPSPIIASRALDLSEPPEPIAWIVDGFAARGYLTVLAGVAGTGKTRLALQLAAEAGTPDNPSIYFDRENGPSQLRRLSESMAVADGSVTLIDMQGLSLTSETILAQLRRELLGIGIATLIRRGTMGTPLIVFDSLRSFAPGLSENSSDDMAPYVGRIAELARATSTAVVLIHHASPKPDAPSLRGSSAITDQCDMAFSLSRRADGLTLAVADHKFRIGREPAPVYFREQQSPLRLSRTNAPTPTTARAAIAQGILAALGAERLSRSAIAERVGRSPKDGTVGNALRELAKDGSIVRNDDATYSLAPSALDTE
jgi:AAA domain